MVELFVRDSGSGEPVVFLHGLFGSADNLGMISRPVEEAGYRVISFDLRNHGRSPHADAVTYPDMAGDVLDGLDALGIDSAHIYGHSMGGKTAMQLALLAPDRVKSLTIGDIAPIAYAPNHTEIVKGMKAVAASDASSRADAKAILKDYEDQPAVLSFLLTNWRRRSDGTHGWRVGLDEIADGYDGISAAVDGDAPYGGPVLFLKGGDSDYIRNEHRAPILERFPKASVRIIAGTGHWFHAEKPDLTARTFLKFIQSADA